MSSFSQQVLALAVGAVLLSLALRRLFRGPTPRGRTVYMLDARGRAPKSSPAPRDDAASVQDWALGRPICPCCGYATDFDASSGCLLCDWEEPLGDRPEWGVDSSDRNDELAAAQARYRATGSVLTPEDRAEWAGQLSTDEIGLRRALLERLEYLRSGDRPDASETWETVDRLLAQLRAEADRKHQSDAQ